MVSRSVWQVNIDHYLVDTEHLTSAAEHGAYMLLLMHYWKHGKLPADETQIRKIAKLNIANWRKLRPVLAQFFQANWKHKRVEKDLLNYAKFIRKQTNNSRARWDQTPVDNTPVINDHTVHARFNVNPLMTQGVDHATGYAVGMPPLSKKESYSYRAEPPVEKQPSKAGSLASALPPGALARQPTRGQTKAQQAWERDLLQKLGARGYAKLIDQLANLPALCERATKAEMRKPGEGLQVIAMGLQKTGRQDNV